MEEFCWNVTFLLFEEQHYYKRKACLVSNFPKSDEKLNTNFEQSQLLTSIAIAISDIVRQKHNRMQEHKKKEMKEQMFKFE